MKIKKPIIWLSLAAFVCAGIPLGSQEKLKTTTIKGFVYWASRTAAEKGKESSITLTPVKDAVVRLRNPAEKKEFSSLATKDDGSYIIKDLPPGIFEPGIEKDSKKYNVESTIRLDPGEDAIISFYLEKDKPVLLPIKHGFFNTPWGIASLAAGTATAGIIIYNKLKKPQEVSATVK